MSEFEVEEVVEEGFDDVFADAVKTSEETSHSGYLSLKDGETVKVLFAKLKIESKAVVWNTATNKTELYDKVKHDGQRPSGRHEFKLALVDAKTGELSPVVFEQGNRFLDSAKANLKAKGFKSIWSIRREGADKETKYHLVHLKDVSDEAYAKVMALQWEAPKHSDTAVPDEMPF